MFAIAIAIDCPLIVIAIACHHHCHWLPLTLPLPLPSHWELTPRVASYSHPCPLAWLAHCCTVLRYNWKSPHPCIIAQIYRQCIEMAFDDGSMVVAAHISMGMRQSIAMVTVMIVSPWYAQFPYICPAYGETYDGSLWATILMEWGKLWNVFPPQMCNQYFLYKCSISAHHNISSANAKLAIRKIWWVTQFITRFWHNHSAALFIIMRIIEQDFWKILLKLTNIQQNNKQTK